MENKENTKFLRGNAAKIIIPFLIIIVIAGIWLIKNTGRSPLITSDNPDFNLYATEDFDIEKLKSYNLPIILDFGADYCPPCREMAPTLIQLNQELQEKAIIKYIDIEKFPELAQNYPISVIPTQIFFDSRGKPYTPTDIQGTDMIMYSLKDTEEHVLTAHEGIMSIEKILSVLEEMGMGE